MIRERERDRCNVAQRGGRKEKDQRTRNFKGLIGDDKQGKKRKKKKEEKKGAEARL